MAEKDEIFSSKIKYKGTFSFKDFYLFCHDWLTTEAELFLSENKYKEKISGDSKKIDIEWVGIKKLTDYFRFDIKITFQLIGLTEIEIQEGSKKIKTNQGTIEMKVKGTLTRDYDGKFEKTATKKFLRSIYEKWVIASRIEQYEEKIIEKSDEFLNQAKAYLDLEGKK
jgi:hypothetical protein